MKDILPGQTAHWQRLEAEFRATVERYGYGEVRTPLLEATELFVKQIGLGTDVVDKEMYSFTRHSDALTIRPEGTAGVARAYVQHSVAGQEPVTRWYYLGPMFRAERPAKGRLRQFHQGGCELFGDPGPVCDAEMIDMCAELLQRLGIGDLEVVVSSLGSGDTRRRFRERLVRYFEPLRPSLSEDSQRRLESNPLRILDSKAPEDQAAAAGAPSVMDVLGDDDRKHFDELRRHLDELKVPYVVDPKLVRGLDYYTRTLFEIRTTTGALGAQDALLGGGRYDGMVASLGSKRSVPAIGFALGLERILSLLELPDSRPSRDCYLAPLCDGARGPALTLAQSLRKLGLVCEVDGRGKSLKAMLRRANSLDSTMCLLLGDSELLRNMVTVKDLKRHEQDEIPLDAAAAVLAHRIRNASPSSGTND